MNSQIVIEALIKNNQEQALELQKMLKLAKGIKELKIVCSGELLVTLETPVADHYKDNTINVSTEVLRECKLLLVPDETEKFVKHNLEMATRNPKAYILTVELNTAIIEEILENCIDDLERERLNKVKSDINEPIKNIKAYLDSTDDHIDSFSSESFKEELKIFCPKYHEEIMEMYWAYQNGAPELHETIKKMIRKEYFGVLTAKKYLPGLTAWVQMGNTLNDNINKSVE